MRKKVALGLVMWSLWTMASNNVAYEDQHVRFTVISDGAVRMEWSKNGQFTDARSFLATERVYPPVKFQVKNQRKQVVISTDRMVLSYQKGADQLSASNLKITSTARADVPFVWTPATEQTGNLCGTYRTLDGCDGEVHYDWNYQANRQDTLALELEKGLLATCGWTWLDDSKNFLFTDDKEPWVMCRKDTMAQDWYFLAYGHDYKSALRDYTLFAGRIPMPPRFAFGYWWSRYWAYSDEDFMNLIKNFDAMEIPIDVLVIDMDWHYSDGKKGGWTGYNWNRELIKNPDSLLRFIHERGLHTTLNLHPADGIKTWEERYPAVAKAMGVTDGSDIPWQGSNKKFMDAWMNEVLRPMEKQGVDFWWLDWQQYPYDKEVAGLSNTWWLNYYVFTDMARNREVRPILYHRWGGLGNHRYQVGFSGDSYSTWASLKYQPYFNATASNVLYGYWSHDLGGHALLHQSDTLNQELYVRWMQFGAFSPIMRTHSTNDSRLVKEPWMQQKDIQQALKEAICLRYQLVPYVYSMARVAYETGVSICRPLYYDYPEANEAYVKEWRNEYMFGDNILIAPIGEPMKDGVSHKKIWLPKGKWYDWFTHEMIEGGQVIERNYALHTYPVFVKAGSIIPIYDKVKRLNEEAPVSLLLFEGERGSEFVLYEDEGNNKDYAERYKKTVLRFDGNHLQGATNMQYQVIKAK